MSRVKDEAPVKTAKPAAKGSAFGKAGALVPFFTNFLKIDVFKPTQGKNARLWTAIGLGVLVGAGLYQLYQTQLRDQLDSLPPFRGIPVGLILSYGIPAGLGVLFAWMIWRLVQFPPFADFLVATEAEMNKVSWTSREDLYRATVVVLALVIFLALYLFGVDFLWSTLLKAIGVLKMSSRSLGDSG